MPDSDPMDRPDPTSEPNSPAGEDEAARRREQRPRTLLSGKLIFGPHDLTADCSVRNLSSGGAKLSTSVATDLPKSFWLIVVKQAIAYRAATTWRRDNELGVRFESQHDLSSDDRDPKLFMVRHVWRQLTER